MLVSVLISGMNMYYSIVMKLYMFCTNKFEYVDLLLQSFFFFKQKTAYEIRISDCSSDVCSSDLPTNIDDPVGGPRLGADYRVRWSPISRRSTPKIGRASCRERVCQYV